MYAVDSDELIGWEPADISDKAVLRIEVDLVKIVTTIYLY